jgi:anti-sigma factor ChrR (cupin superfamily)
MKCTNLQELAAAHAAGALSRGDAAHVEALAAHDPDVRDELARLHDTTTAFVAGTSETRSEPSAAVRSRILEAIRRTPQAVPTSAPISPAAGMRFLSRDQGEWVTTPTPGLRIKPLSISRDVGYWMFLAELAPGTRFPEHDHASSEELYMISGDLITEGHTLRAGDFIHFEPGTHHHELVSPGGCVALMVERAPQARREAVPA